MSRDTSGAGLLTLLAVLALAVPAQGLPPSHVRSVDVWSADGLAMPVSLERTKRKLGERPQSALSALRLQFHVEVFWRAPALGVLKDIDLTYGPVPYGARTHSEFLAQVTPEAFRSPPIDVSASVAWLARWLTGSTGRRRSD